MGYPEEHDLSVAELLSRASERLRRSMAWVLVKELSLSYRNKDLASPLWQLKLSHAP